jgi:FlaA1/EpsC-like NDP-sugar epimerase
MIRLFNVYYPTRMLVLLVCDVLLVGGSFLLAAACLLGADGYVGLINALVYENGLLKIAAITFFTLLLIYYFDLYGPRRTAAGWEIYFRLLLVLSVLTFTLVGLIYFFPELEIGPNVSVLGVSLLTVFLVLWRWAYEWIIILPVFSERVYVLGGGERARRVVELLRGSRDAGMEVVGWQGESEAQGRLDRFAAELRAFRKQRPEIDRVIVAMEDRRDSMPVRELLCEA